MNNTDNLILRKVKPEDSFMTMSYGYGSGSSSGSSSGRGSGSVSGSGSGSGSGKGSGHELFLCRNKSCGARYNSVLDECPICGTTKVFVVDRITPCIGQYLTAQCHVRYENDDGSIILNPGYCSSMFGSRLFCYEGTGPLS